MTFTLGPPTAGRACARSAALLVLVLLACSPAAAAGPATVTVDLKTTVRERVPRTLFGFHTVWLPFQHGYLRNGRVRPEVIEWLKPFSGAMYRYPGGEKSNWFDWRQSVGDAWARAGQETENGYTRPVLFGIDEFLGFVQSVNGVPLVVANLYGQRGNIWPEDDLVALNHDLVVHVNSKAKPLRPSAAGEFEPCEMTRPCYVAWWELGNELDWKGIRWPVEKIVGRASKIAEGMKQADPDIHLIAFSRTGGFLPDGNVGVTAPDFNRAIAHELGGRVDAISTHLYYEGRTIPEVLSYVDQLSSDLTLGQGKPARIFVTEHAKWPNTPRSGAWQDNWYTSGSLGGAIASADFFLGVLPNPQIDVAIWHALGARGPWQLFYLSRSDDHLWPNTVYWALRVLREGVLDDVVASTTESNPAVWPGYAVRSAFMRSRDATRYSLLAVNRSQDTQPVRLRVDTWAGRNLLARHAYITGDHPNLANLEGHESAVVMRHSNIPVRFDSKGDGMIALPPLSVSSIIFDTAAGTIPTASIP
jgi:alpha-L-arabinofuranosidase